MNVLNVHSTITGDYSRGETPVLIPNTEVKTFSADDTCREADWKNRTLPVFKNHKAHIIVCFFCCVVISLHILCSILIVNSMFLFF